MNKFYDVPQNRVKLHDVLWMWIGKRWTQGVENIAK
jgi:hypothetical protein